MPPPAMALLDSRRLTGPTLVLDRPGAVLDVQLDEPDRSRVIEAWGRAARSLLDAVGWTRESTAVRLFDGGASLALSAPIDALYVATEVNEWAWDTAVAELRGEPANQLQATAGRIKARIAGEANPALLALRDAARQRNLTFLSDDDGASIG